VLEQRFRELMARVCAPVSVVTTADDGGPHGTTVSSLVSVSLHPALVSVSLTHGSRVLERILAVERFGINVLAADQESTARVFAQRGVDRFAAIEWSLSHGLPRLAGTCGWAACEVWEVLSAGDHLVVIGRVTDAQFSPLPPLVYGHRTFGTHSSFAARSRRAIDEVIAACAC
jgi:flavin reductase (DIM6/NTAB) family NADH-FMN oxidoreductase RutF